MVPVQAPQPCGRAAESQAVGQEAACDNELVSGATRSPAAARCLWPTLSSEEALLEPDTEGAKRDVMLPVTRVLALGECQRLWAFPEGDRRCCPDTPWRCYMAASLAGAWLVSQGEATASEYLEQVDGEFGPSPRALPQAPGTKLTLVWRWGLVAAPGSRQGSCLRLPVWLAASLSLCRCPHNLHLPEATRGDPTWRLHHHLLHLPVQQREVCDVQGQPPAPHPGAEWWQG